VTFCEKPRIGDLLLKKSWVMILGQVSRIVFLSICYWEKSCSCLLLHHLCIFTKAYIVYEQTQSTKHIANHKPLNTGCLQI